jgi:hypothetical protein
MSSRAAPPVADKVSSLVLKLEDSPAFLASRTFRYSFGLLSRAFAAVFMSSLAFRAHCLISPPDSNGLLSSRVQPLPKLTVHRNLEVLARSLREPETGYVRPQSHGLQYPNANGDYHDDVQDRFDAGGHGDETIDQPQPDADYDQNKDKIDQGHA